MSRKQQNMRASVYLSAAVLDQLRAAQGVLDAHITCSATGRCLHCGALGPCLASEQAVADFRRYDRLPRRTPGATRPELINARRLMSSSGGLPDQLVGPQDETGP